ncbi:hypothetical protein F4777DRAFT_193960 [Nemania sp. FL0916]|nr:hypothetical protein F4777DRAFT_193960 [Nemania sp. FL0916]
MCRSAHGLLMLCSAVNRGAATLQQHRINRVSQSVSQERKHTQLQFREEPIKRGRRPPNAVYCTPTYNMPVSSVRKAYRIRGGEEEREEEYAVLVTHTRTAS